MADIATQPVAARSVRSGALGVVTLLLIALVAVGVGARFVGLQTNLYWRDEVATSLRLAGLTMSEVAQQLGRDHELRPSEIRALVFPARPAPLSEVLGSVLEDEPHRAPLYYALVFLHSSLFGTSALSLRLLSVVCGLLALPAGYWLCRELFADRAVAVFFVTLLATSPFHVQYAQEAREYSLWTALILAASAALLMALRQARMRNWILYAAISVVAVLTSPLHLLVIGSHGMFLVWRWRFSSDADRRWWPLPGYLVTFGVMAACAVVTLAPWLWAGIEHRANARDATEWMSMSNPWRIMLREWIKTFSRPFVGFAGEEWLYPVIPRPVAYAFSFAALAVTGWSLVTLWLRRADRNMAAPFVSLIILVSVLALLAPDLLFGGVRSFVGRYMIPAWIGFALAVAAMFAAGCRTPTRAARLWSVGLFTLLTVSATSSAVFVAHTGGGKSIVEAAGDDGLLAVQEIAASSRPFVISEYVGRWDIRAADTLVVGLLLDDPVRFVISDDPALALRLTQQGEVFVLEPSEQFIAAVADTGVLESVRPVPHILRLRAR